MSDNTRMSYPRIAVKDLQDDINDLWMKYGPVQVSREIPFGELMEAFATDAGRLRLPIPEARERVNDLRWALASAEFSLGYMLLTKNFAKYPHGEELIEYFGIPGDAGVDIGDMHFWHHMNLAIETIYRVWERLAGLLQFYCHLDEQDKLYFDGVVDALVAHPIIGRIEELKSLKSHVKHWNKLSSLRNGLSHKSSLLYQEPEVQFEPTEILRPDGAPHVKIRVKMPDLIPPLEDVKTRYERCGNAVGDVLLFIRALSVERPDLRPQAR